MLATLLTFQRVCVVRHSKLTTKNEEMNFPLRTKNHDPEHRNLEQRSEYAKEKHDIVLCVVCCVVRGLWCAACGVWGVACGACCSGVRVCGRVRGCGGGGRVGVGVGAGVGVGMGVDVFFVCFYCLFFVFCFFFSVFSF